MNPNCPPSAALPRSRSLGLVLVEAATGRYPYDAHSGPVELMIQVTR
jgi:hypothetical protein